MGSVVIVSIPDKQDPVWKVSSEKIPHMTLLFLGEMDEGPELAHIETYVAHVAEVTMSRFGASVDDRGPLGPDDADVLFFDKADLKNVEEARNDLLADSVIRAAFNKADQYPEWTPHLTLGYPATPANDDAVEYPINYVQFNRLGLWFGDSDGPEFKLKTWHHPLPQISMSAESLIEDTLKHYGVKGMRWGQRNSSSSGGSAIGSGGTIPIKKKVSEDAAAVNKSKSTIKTHGTDALSNKDLQGVVNRMNLEQQYSRLTTSSDNKSKITRGNDKVKQILAPIKTVQEVYSVINSPAFKALKLALGSKK